MDNIPYREALGSLMWLQVATRPDLSFSVNLLARFAHNPGRMHWNALKHVMAYVKGTINYGISYQAGGDLRPIGYVNSDFAGCKDSRRSTEGSIFMVAGGPVSWECKRQDTVALSTVEAEYMAFSCATAQAIWLSKFFNEIGLNSTKPTIIYADNNGAISNSINNKHHRRTKHIDVRHHFVKEHTESGDILFQYTPSNENIADILTKPLARDATRKFTTYMSLDTDTTRASIQGEC